jgi:hypothetical protein
MSKCFHRGLVHTNWNFKHVNKKAEPSGPNFAPYNPAWVANEVPHGTDEITAVYRDLKKRQKKLKRLKNPGGDYARHSLLYPGSILGWEGDEEMIGSREHLLTLLGPGHPWGVTTKTTRQFAAYCAQQKPRIPQPGCQSIVALVTVCSDDVTDNTVLADNVIFHQIGLQLDIEKRRAIFFNPWKIPDPKHFAIPPAVAEICLERGINKIYEVRGFQEQDVECNLHVANWVLWLLGGGRIQQNQLHTCYTMKTQPRDPPALRAQPGAKYANTPLTRRSWSSKPLW